MRANSAINPHQAAVVAAWVVFSVIWLALVVVLHDWDFVPSLAWLLPGAAACLLLGLFAPRWSVTALPLLLAAAFAAVVMIGYEGEDTFLMGLFLAELYLGVPGALLTLIGVAIRKSATPEAGPGRPARRAT